jgi:hypothetical protein
VKPIDPIDNFLLVVGFVFVLSMMGYAVVKGPVQRSPAPCGCCP